ncbi:hypothetical protein Enr13x_77670 [Stieleria neptunia]|uniref:Type II secretion system protein n=1 Tax=Stieleria neptunia TaxID=2527979 RepID=A0A518I421_9BACT|nr:hypothetical protein [Stieleria neptunia]QDV47855.1 hypothetical protein Enr13x_77670 [Stieleria neptunia]
MNKQRPDYQCHRANAAAANRRSATIRRIGLSILEVIVSLTLVATIMLVSLNASANMMRNRIAAGQAVQGQRLAGYYLDEISTLDFREASDEAVFGPEPGESAANRASFDDVDDFDGFHQDTPTFRDGGAIPDFDAWAVDVSVTPLSRFGSGFQTDSDANSQFRRVAVTVTGPDASPQTFRMIVSITPSDRSTSQSFERLRRVELRFSGDRRLNVVVPLRNTPAPIY